MATTVDTLVVRIEADLKGVRRDLARLERSTAQTSQKMTKSLGRIGTVTTAVISGVFVQQLVRGTLALTNFASDMEEMSQMSEAVFGGFIDSVRKDLGDFGESVGRSRFELEAMAASVQDTFVPLGFARGQAADLSVQLTKLAVDVGSFKNELETNVMAAFQSALVGNHEAVRRFGIVITEAELKAELFRMGITKNAKDVDAQTKVQARLNLIMAGTADAQGDAGRTAGSYANLVRALDAQVKLLSAELGNELLPTMKDIVVTTTEVIKGFRGFFRAIGLVSGKNDALVKNLERVRNAQQKVAEAQAKLATNQNYIPFIKQAERANSELTAALKEQDELFEPIINQIRGVGKETNEATEATEKLTQGLTDSEKVVHDLNLQLQVLKANQSDSTGITAKLLEIQNKLGKEYGKVSHIIVDLLEQMFALTEESKKQEEEHEKLADTVIDGVEALREYRKEQKELEQARIVNALQKNIDALNEFKDVTNELTNANSSLKKQLDGVSESELRALEIFEQLGVTSENQKQTIRNLTSEFVNLNLAIDRAAEKQAKFDNSVSRGVSIVSDMASEQEKLAISLRDIQNAYISGSISAEEFAAAQAQIGQKMKELDPMFAAFKRSAEKAGDAVADSLADALVEGKLSLDSFKDIFKLFIKELIAEAIKTFIIRKLLASAFSGFAGGGSVNGGTNMGNTTLGHAGGGSVSGPVLVGERGPELFVPHSAGVIKNNMDSKNMMGGQTTIVNQTLNIETGVSQTVRAEITSLLPQIKQNTIAAVVDQRRRGGSLANAFGA